MNAIPKHPVTRTPVDRLLRGIPRWEPKYKLGDLVRVGARRLAKVITSRDYYGFYCLQFSDGVAAFYHESEVSPL